MKTNPVYKREIMVSARGFKLALMLLVFNGILALVALLNMYSNLAQVRMTAEVQYSSFLDLYLFVAVLEFMMLIFIMPAITSGSISGERERQTLELMLTTKMKPSEIVLGKLASALSTVFLMIVSSFPIVSLVFVYGGVTLKDVGLLMICYLASALFVGSLGISCSAIFGRSTLATAVSYGITALSVVGTYGINEFVYYLSGMNMDSYLVSMGRSVGSASSGNFLYLMLINPLSTFLLTIARLTGREQQAVNVTDWFGDHGWNLVTANWTVISVVLQFVCAGLLILVAIRCVESWKRR